VSEFFGLVVGLGFVLCVGTGCICAVSVRSRPGPTFRDPTNARVHWRGALQVGLLMMALGAVGWVVVS
jgi:hypothetical protein